MDEHERSQRLEKIRFYTEELKKLEEEERLLLEENHLDEESAWALFQALMSDGDMDRVQADAQEKIQLIERDLEIRIAANSSTIRPQSLARRHLSRI